MLIIGINSAIGQAFAKALVERGDIVHGTTRREPAISSYPSVFLDLAAPDAMRTALPAADVAVFCAAMARFADCRAEPGRAHHVNVEAPVALARRLLDRGTRVVLLSTGAVFDGRRPRRHADEPTCPTSAYGRLKVEAEAQFLALGSAASVLRLSKVLTPQLPLFSGWLSAFSQNQRVQAFTDLHFCPLPMADVVGALLALISDGGGIYQASGSDDIAYSEAARHLARRNGADPRLVDPRCAADHGIPSEEILRYTSLDTCRLSALTGFNPPSPFAVLNSVFSPPEASALRAVG